MFLLMLYISIYLFIYMILHAYDFIVDILDLFILKLAEICRFSLWQVYLQQLIEGRLNPE